MRINTRKLSLYKESLKLTSIQQQIIIGLILGDAHLATQNKGRTYRLLIEQSIKRKIYVQHLYDVFKDFVLTPPKIINRNPNKPDKVNIYFKTISHSAFQFYGQLFYKNGKKIIPIDIQKYLTPTALAYWFMDDGALKGTDRKGLRLNTEGFTEISVQLLCDKLKKIGILSKVHLQNHLSKGVMKTYYIIYITAVYNDQFIKTMKSINIPGLNSKLKL